MHPAPHGQRVSAARAPYHPDEVGQWSVKDRDVMLTTMFLPTPGPFLPFVNIPTGINLAAASAYEPLPPGAADLPSRSPLRTPIENASGSRASVHPPSHTPSLSLSSLSMFNMPPGGIQLRDAPPVPTQTTVSRAHSLRAQAKHPDPSLLGRSTSMKAAGEVSWRR